MRNVRCDWLFLASLGAALRVITEQELGLNAEQTEPLTGTQPRCSDMDCFLLSLCEPAEGLGLL